MGVPHHRFQITDSEVAGAGLEYIPKGQRCQRRVATRAPSTDRKSVAVDETFRGEILRPIDAVIDINDAPFVVQPFAVGAAVAGASPVVDVQDGKSSARPILEFKRQRS